MKSEARVVLLTGEESWDGVYVDGKLVCSRSALYMSVHLPEILEAIGISFESQTVKQEWLDKNGDYPPELRAVPGRAVMK